MRLETILGRLCEFKGFVINGCEMIGKEKLLIDIRARKGSKGLCSNCGRRTSTYDTLPVRHFEFIPIWGLAVFFVYAMRRIDCPTCGATVERVPWSDGKSQQTIHQQAFLASWAKLLSWKTVAERFGTSWHSVWRSVTTRGPGP